jgi:hypothetical protein
MLAAIERAHLLGELTIPTAKPRALRLEFEKLRGAFRREGQGETVDQLGFYVTDTSLIIRVKAQSPLMQDLSAALGDIDTAGAKLFSTLSGESDASPDK